MLRSKHLVGLILAATLIATLVPFSAMVYAQTKEEAKGFIKTAEQAKDKADELMEIMKNEGLPIPEDTMKRYDEGVGNLTAAEAELEKDEPDLSLAVELAKKAMEAFKEVYEELYTLLEGAEVMTASDEDEKAKGMFVAIDRAREKIDRIENVTERITSTPEIQTFLDWVDGNLTFAKANLTEAETALKLPTPNIEWVVGNLTEARENISDAFAALRLIGGWTSFWRVESFLMGIRKSVDRTRELLERAEKQGLDVRALMDKLKGVEALIDEAGDLRKAGDIKGAVEKLNDIREILRDIHQELAKLRKGGPKGG